MLTIDTLRNAASHLDRLSAQARDWADMCAKQYREGDLVKSPNALHAHLNRAISYQNRAARLRRGIARRLGR